MRIKLVQMKSQGEFINDWKLYITQPGVKKVIKIAEFKDCLDLKDAQNKSCQFIKRVMGSSKNNNTL